MQQWNDYVQDFGIRGAIVESGGKIEHLHERYATSDQPALFIIDEAHRYRNELTDDYQYLHQLTRSNADNKVILLTATPYNNRPQDLFAMIKLFQTPSRSTIHSVDNLSLRFHELIAEYRSLEKKGKKEMTERVKEDLQKLSQELRLLIEPIIIRRSRIDLREIKEYADDLAAQKISFPEVEGPLLIEYDLGGIRERYISTLVKLTKSADDGGFIGARYMSATYLCDKIKFGKEYSKFFDETDLGQSQRNLADFMKRLLVMRFESSKYAFKSTLTNIIQYHRNIIKWWGKGYVPILKKGNLQDPDELNIDELLEKIDLANQGEYGVDKIKKIAVPVPIDFFGNSDVTYNSFITDVWNNLSINAMIRNLTYTGILRSGESRSPVIEELQVIPPDMYEKAQDILAKRNTEAADNRTYPMNIKSRCLLNGKVYCADCGSRLTIMINGRFNYDENGEKYKRLRYSCYGKTRKQTDCHGQTGYSSNRLDGVADGVIRHIFDCMKSIPKSEVVNHGLAALQKEQESRYKTAQREYTKAAADLAELKAEALKAIRGQSKFAPELLNELITEAETALAEIEATRNTAKRELESCKNRMSEMQAKYDEVISWTELYEAADLAAKKMIVANLINRIDVGTDYDIHIDFNIDLSHFNIQLDCCA